MLLQLVLPTENGQSCPEMTCGYSSRSIHDTKAPSPKPVICFGFPRNAGLEKEQSALGEVQGPLTGGAVMIPAAGDVNAFDSSMLGCSCVLKIDGKWYMYYSGGVEPGTPLAGDRTPGFPMRAGLATSTDGLNWERVQGSCAGGSILDTGEKGEHDAEFIGVQSIHQDLPERINP